MKHKCPRCKGDGYILSCGDCKHGNHHPMESNAYCKANTCTMISNDMPACEDKFEPIKDVKS